MVKVGVQPVLPVTVPVRKTTILATHQCYGDGDTVGRLDGSLGRFTPSDSVTITATLTDGTFDLFDDG